MMDANIIFDNVKAYNVIKFDVKLGETFKIELIDAPGVLRWFFDNDPILSVSVDESGASATVKTTSIGKSEIQLQADGRLQKTLYVEVYDNIAVALNPTVGEPVLK
jgi:hypothetical protein